MGKKYSLEKEVYFETVWFIRQYPRLLKEYNEIMSGSALWGKMTLDGMPHGSSSVDIVVTTAGNLAEIAKKIAPIQKALNRIPEEYREGILGNIIDRKPYPIEADITTWKRWKRRFVYFVAMERRYQ